MYHLRTPQHRTQDVLLIPEDYVIIVGHLITIRHIDTLFFRKTIKKQKKRRLKMTLDMGLNIVCWLCSLLSLFHERKTINWIIFIGWSIVMIFMILK